jgi:hypothetical protein
MRLTLGAEASGGGTERTPMSPDCSAAGISQMVWHLGHLSRLPAAVSGAFSVVLQPLHVNLIGMV